MFERISNSLDLAKSSWRVLVLDKEMLWFPVLNGISTGIAAIILCLLGWTLLGADLLHQTGSETPVPDESNWRLIVLVVGGLLFTLVAHLLNTFFNVALTTCAMIRLHNEDPILRDGLALAWYRKGLIVQWAIIAATVGFILKALSKSRNLGAAIAQIFVSLGWSISTYFVVPAIVGHGGDVKAVFYKSVEAVRQRWGEALIINFGINLLQIPVMLVFGAIMLFGFFQINTSPNLAMMIIFSGAVFMVFAIILLSTLNAIAKAAIYLHAVGDLPSDFFDAKVLESVFSNGHVDGLGANRGQTTPYPLP